MWQRIVTELLDAGLSESAIAKRTNYAQSTIHRLKTGKVKEPSYSRGQALLALHRELCGGPSAV